MTAPDERGDKGRHPVLTGILALVAVTVSVGLILGGAALAATKVLGGDNGSSGEGNSGEGQSMYLPRPEETAPASGPLTTLATDDEGSTEPPPTARETEAAAKITISASTSQGSAMETFEISGTYPQGEGAIMQVQRFEGNAWSDFQAQTQVNGGSFSMPIQTGVVGENRFRVKDSASALISNEVTVTIN